MEGGPAADSGLMAEDSGDLAGLMMDVFRHLNREPAALAGVLADASDQVGEAGQLVLLALGVVRPLQGDDGCANRAPARPLWPIRWPH